MADESAGRKGSMSKPAPPPEAPLIRLVRLGARMSTQQAAIAAGISKARWSQVENGYERKQDGLYHPVSASDGLLAAMADAVGLSAARLESEGGRPDAAAVLREMDRRKGHGEPAAPAALETGPPRIVSDNWGDENVRVLWRLAVTEDQRLSLIEAYLAGLPANGARRASSG